MKIIGTYQIINTVDQKSYVGSSDDIERRWKKHKQDLNNGEHHNHPLQGAWNKYKSAAFEFHILEENDTHEEALQDEQLLLNTLWDNGKTCYNTARDVFSGMKGRKHTPEARAAQRAAHKGKSTGPFKQDRKDAISAAKKGKKRKPTSPEHCDALSVAVKASWDKRRAAKALLGSTVLPPDYDQS